MGRSSFSEWLLVRRLVLGELLRIWWQRRSPPPAVRAVRKFLELVGELHRRGYERFRLYAGLAPSGAYLRAAVLVHGTELRTATYSSGGEYEMLFDWRDAGRLDVSALADRFLAEYPALAEAARAPDPAYVRWYAAMLEKTAPRGFVYFSADFDLPASGVGVGGVEDLSIEVERPPP